LEEYMISDVLFESVDNLDGYLESPICDDVYVGEFREVLLKLRGELVSVQRFLDAPPGSEAARMEAEILVRWRERPLLAD
jgi:hypothetical protein